MRDYDVAVPIDCVGAQTAARNAAALRHLARRTASTRRRRRASACPAAPERANAAQPPSEPYSDSANCQASSRELKSWSPRLFAGVRARVAAAHEHAGLPAGVAPRPPIGIAR